MQRPNDWASGAPGRGNMNAFNPYNPNHQMPQHQDHGHSHGGGSGHQDEEEDAPQDYEFTLSELVPSASVKNLLVKVKEVRGNGEAVVESAHGSCILMYDLTKLSIIIRVGSTIRIIDGYGMTRENGQLVIGLEEPEEESAVVEFGADEDKITPPDNISTENISSINRCYGVLVIRENRCLLCPSSSSGDKYAFPVSEADGDEPERCAAIRAFEAITEIDNSEMYLLHEVPPLMSYEEEFTSTLFVAYSRRPFNKDVPPSKTESYAWFTFEEALEALDTDASKACLQRAVAALSAAIESGYVRPHFDARFGPATGEMRPYPETARKPHIPEPPSDKETNSGAEVGVSTLSTKVADEPPHSSSTNTVSSQTKPAPTNKIDVKPTPSSSEASVLAMVARTSALFYLNERKAISETDFLSLLTANSSLSPSGASIATSSRSNRGDDQRQPVPVTVLCGFLGSGKTTLIKHLMSSRHGMRIALVVNDMAEVNIDAHQISQKVDDTVIEMTNGCICCTLREDLLGEIRSLAEQNRYDYIIVESTGIGDPMGIAETFTFPIDDTRTLNDIARLDTMVTVVDSSSLLKDMNLKGKNTSDDSGKLSKLLTEQIEFADVIVLNKIDLVSVQEMTKVRGVVSSLNSRARKIECIRSAVAVGDVLNTRLFSFENAQGAPGWLKSLRGEEIPESEEFGISSFVWRRKQPIDVNKLLVCLDSTPFNDKIIRSKGIVWLANSFGKDKSVEWSGAGHAYKFYEGRPWGGNNDGSAEEPSASGISEIVFIGFFDDATVKEAAIQMLDRCLVEPNPSAFNSETPQLEILQPE